MATAHIISIGSELAYGRTVDTNAAWIAARLAACGIRATRHVTIADDLNAIRDALMAESRDAALVIVTGGLGPTDDDLTRDALAAALGAPLETQPQLVEALWQFFASRNRQMPDSNLRQAQVPRGAAAIPNQWGTAPGLAAALGAARVFCLPGVPSEMKPMFEASVLPHLAALGGGGVILETVVQTYGGGEAEIGERIHDLMARGRNPEVGTTAKDAIIGIRVVAAGATGDAAKNLIDADVAEIHRRLGGWVVGLGEITLQDAVAQLLFASRRTVATAESCTGGLIAKRLTDVPGSSGYMLAGFVTYSNDAKVRDLGVDPALLAAHGAVSEQVAAAMALGCRARTGADYALSATGVAGPGGGTQQKPVGLVYVGLASAAGTIVRELRFGDHIDRAQIRDRTAKAALNMLRLALAT